MPERQLWFGVSTGEWNGADVAASEETIPLVIQADRDGLDLFTVADHPYFGDKLDSYALLGFLLGRTERICVRSRDQPAMPSRACSGPHDHVAVGAAFRWAGGAGVGGGGDLGHDRQAGGAPSGRRCRRARHGGGDHADPGVGGRRRSGRPWRASSTRRSGVNPAPVAAPPIWTGSSVPVRWPYRRRRHTAGCPQEVRTGPAASTGSPGRGSMRLLSRRAEIPRRSSMSTTSAVGSQPSRSASPVTRTGAGSAGRSGSGLMNSSPPLWITVHEGSSSAAPMAIGGRPWLAGAREIVPAVREAIAGQA